MLRANKYYNQRFFLNKYKQCKRDAIISSSLDTWYIFCMKARKKPEKKKEYDLFFIVARLGLILMSAALFMIFLLDYFLDKSNLF